MKALIIIASVLAACFIYDKIEELKRLKEDKFVIKNDKSQLEDALKKYRDLDD